MTTPLLVRDGLVALADSVRRQFEAQGVPAVVTRVGLAYRSLWATSRVVFIPGEFTGEATPKPLREGRLTPPEHTKSDNPRELVTWERVCTAAILGVDKDNPADAQAQLEATSALQALTIRAMWNATDPSAAAHGLPGTREFGYAGQASLVFEGGSVTRLYPPVIGGYGSEVLVVFMQRGPGAFDAAEDLVTPEFSLTRVLSAAQ
jgi:hypothetical protein